MDLLLILTYTAFCVAVFKIFKIPLNKWSVPTAILGGVFLIGALIFLMNYNHPYSEISRQYFVTTPIVPIVSGQVISVSATGNQKLEAGDELFRIDPTPFQNKVNTIKPQLLVAQEDLTRAIEIMNRGIGKQRDVDLTKAQVENLQAQLATAEFELAGTIVRAPTNGYVTQVALRPGMMAVSFPLRPVMVFIHDEGHAYVAWFRQNSLLRLQKGDEAEVAFDGLPGKIFSGEVELVLPAMAEGQITATGNLVDPGQNRAAGRVAVLIKITDPNFAQYADRVPGGAFAQTAIYTEHFHHVSIIRKVLLRMSAWMNYLYPFH